MPNLVANSSQQLSARKVPHFLPAKTPSTACAARPQVAPNPRSKPASDFQRNPAIYSSSCGTADRIVPVFTSKVRSAIPRGLADVKPAGDGPVKSKPTNVVQPTGVVKPTFTKAPCFPPKPATNTSGKSLVKTPGSKVIGVAQKNPSIGNSFKPKLPPQNTPKSASTFQVLSCSGKMTPKCATGQFSSAAADKNMSSGENGVQLPAISSSRALPSPHVPQMKSTAKSTSRSTIQAISPTHSASIFSVSGTIDFTLECRGSQQSAPLNPQVRGELGKTMTGKFLDKSKMGQDRPESQKRKSEVCSVFLILLQYKILFSSALYLSC